MDYAPAMYLSASLGVVDKANIADALKGAGPQVREWRLHMWALHCNFTHISCIFLYKARM